MANMKMVWKSILPALLVFLGQLMFPDKIIVTQNMTYVWLVLLQLPVTIVMILLVFALTAALASVTKGGAASIILIILGVIMMSAIVSIGAFYLYDAILPGIRIVGFPTHLFLGLIYGALTPEIKKNED